MAARPAAEAGAHPTLVKVAMGCKIGSSSQAVAAVVVLQRREAPAVGVARITARTVWLGMGNHTMELESVAVAAAGEERRVTEGAGAGAAGSARAVITAFEVMTEHLEQAVREPAVAGPAAIMVAEGAVQAPTLARPRAATAVVAEVRPTLRAARQASRTPAGQVQRATARSSSPGIAAR